ncbi:MAG TPA: N-acetyltransferase, partial [Thalassospira sp.]|nr:N-acetyltransferase [Thalassospira sp.]
MVDAAQDTPGYNLVSIGEHKINIRPAVKDDLANVVALDDRT